MTRIRCAATVAMLVMTSAMAVAADSPLGSISKDADVVIRLKAPKATVGKIAGMVDKVMPGFGGMVSQQASNVGALISNPTSAGVDQTKDWYIGVFTNGEEDPSVLFAVPVTDAEAAKGAIGDEFSTKVADKWLFYSKDEDVLPEGSSSDSVAAAMRGEPTTVFDKGDFSIFVNIGNLTEAYSDQLEQGKQQALEQMQQIPAGGPGVDPEAIKEFQTAMLERVFQGMNDAEQCTIAINFGDDGITAEDYLSFEADSSTAALLADHPRSDMKNIAKLPADAVMLFGASTNMSKLIEWGADISAKFAGDTPEAAKMAEFQTGLKGLKWGSVVGAFSLGSPEDGIVRSVSIAELSPTDKYKELNRKMAASMETVKNQFVEQTSKLEADAESFGAAKADVLTLTMKFDESVDQGGMIQQVLGALFGPEGLKTRTVYQTDKVIQSMGGGKEAMAAVLKNIDGSASVSADHRKGLIADPNVLFLIDVPGLAVQALRIASAVPGLPVQIKAEQLDNLKFEKSFMGFSAAADKNAIRVKSRIPAAQIQALVQLGFFAQNLRQ